MIGFETDDATCSPTQAFDVDATHVFSAEEAVRMCSWMYLSSAGPQNDVEKDLLILLSDLSIVEYDQAPKQQKVYGRGSQQHQRLSAT